MDYVVGGMVLVVAAASAFLFAFVRHESALVPRASMRAARQALRRHSVLVVSGDQCDCGGVIGLSGRVSEKFGPTLGCTGCDQSWTTGGHRILTRPSRPSRPDRRARQAP
jgi:hypothetical protein